MENGLGENRMNNREPARPDPIRDLNLDGSAWIEASAGTGKTYTIEKLFLRLVAEKGLMPKEILMLSFTRKTADELRERIRSRLKLEKTPREDESEWTNAQRKKFEGAYLLCDETAVHTLHGFCQKALLTHALEMHLPLAAVLEDEKNLIPEALDGLLRGSWSRDPDLLRELAAIEGNAEKRNSLLCGLARAFQPERGDRLHVRPDPNWLGSLTDRLVPLALELKAAWSALGKRDKKGEHDVMTGILDLLPTLASQPDLEKALTLAEHFANLHGGTKPYKSGFASVLSKSAAGDPGWKRFTDLCDTWRGFRDDLKNRRSIFNSAAEDAAKNERIAKAALAIRARMAADKARLGLMTYADMESKVAVAAGADPKLAEKLGMAFKACVVDEFQDTAPLQWKLLKALCLDGSRKIPLFLVGDPKQAIYGFRGGDLGTYLAARRHFHDLARQGLATGLPLERNYRSSLRLIEALNTVFPHSEWFGPSPVIPPDPHWRLPAESKDIVFTKALPKPDAPSGNEKPVELRDFTGANGITGPKADVSRAVRKWISSRILSLAPEMPYPDMAVLTRTNSESMAMERHFRKVGIPCRLHKAPDGWNGPKVDALRMLLELLENAAEPSSQASIMLLPFLRAPGAEPPGIPAEPPALILEWARLAEARRWPEFFRSVLFDSGYAYRMVAENGLDSELQTLRALAAELATEGLRHGCSLRALRERFKGLGKGEEDADIPLPAPGNSGEGGVNILTLHGSKGLEYRAVFLASLSQGYVKSYPVTLRGEEGFEHVLCPLDPEMLAREDRQRLEEEKRLFYVGFTRAKELFFIPLLPKKFGSKSSGPLGGFAADALRQSAEKYPDLFRFDETSPVDGATIRLRRTPTTAPPTGDISASPWPERDPAEPARDHLWKTRRRLASYSRLARNIASITGEEEARPDRDEIAIPETEPSAVSTLPFGSNTGNALHALLEKVDFALAAKTESPSALFQSPGIQEAIARQIAEHNLPESCAMEIAELIWHSLRMEIPDPASAGSPVFRLADVKEHRSEVDFLMRTHGTIGSLPEDVSLREGFLQGSIDLVFRHSGRYYLLDWKSTRLEGYGPEQVKAGMREHNYELQVQLYSVVLDRWLQARLPDYDPVKHFGGAIWMFLRGAPQAAVTGIFSGYCKRPTILELREEFPRLLREKMGMT